MSVVLLSNVIIFSIIFVQILATKSIAESSRSLIDHAANHEQDIPVHVRQSVREEEIQCKWVLYEMRKLCFATS